MGKTLNYIVIFIGLILLGSYFINAFTEMKIFRVSLGGKYLTISADSGKVSNVIVKLMVGLAMLQHAIATLKFRKKNLYAEADPQIFDSGGVLQLRGLSRISFISGLFIVIISFWYFVRSFVIMSACIDISPELIPLIIFSFSSFAIYSLCPLILVFRNFSLNSRIERILNEEKIRERMRNMEG